MSERFDKDGKPVANGQGPKAARPAGPSAQLPSSSKRPSQYSAARPTPGAKQPPQAASRPGQSQQRPAPAERPTRPVSSAAAAAPKAQAPTVKKAAAPVTENASDEKPGKKAGAGLGAVLRGGADKVGAVASSAREQVSSAQQGDPVTSKASLGGRGPRRARLRLSRIDPWSVAKVAFLLSVALGVVAFVAVLITWSVMGAAGVWDAINSIAASVASNSDGTSSFDIQDYVGTGRVLGLTLVVSVVNVFLLTAMATLGAFLYNMAAALLGGVEVTLSEDAD
ncbi:DUF3566 domain-containing protein [Nocardioides yefusunii]|uniref:DUF3566 domain-containing protein n=1 Tax=Nocardioides yefusunii TaxID=2500546 RepID=A0ABW1R0S6_9ACTN|nr:DUF3566 domain-containing protein [Nocardioides yefusunii]